MHSDSVSSARVPESETAKFDQELKIAFNDMVFQGGKKMKIINEKGVFIDVGHMSLYADKYDSREYEHLFRYGHPTIIPVTEVITSNEADQQIIQLIQKLNLSVEIEEINDRQIVLDVNGDWKHSHRCIDNLMRDIFGLPQIGEQVTSEDGSDWYRARHLYFFDADKEV